MDKSDSSMSYVYRLRPKTKTIDNSPIFELLNDSDSDQHEAGTCEVF
jgi:hypothetical protein